MVASRGPVPKRSNERRRRNKVEGGGESIITVLGSVDIPLLPAHIDHPAVRGWYEALTKSGQSVYYEPSDWASAIIAAELMQKVFKGALGSGQLMGHALQIMKDLGTTESDRRRMRVEVERGGDGDEVDPGAEAIGHYQTLLEAGK